MKKSIISALTTALVVGAASTTFAAANPFEDVPADHWAYDAIAQLAADGVIEGYGDGTDRGDQEITRYEMARMVARAMAKGANGADKALIDKLAAEFADELNNLGVRVAALEKKVDNVKWTGAVRYRYINQRNDGLRPGAGIRERNNAQYITLRLEPEMQINKNWTGHARIDYNLDMDAARNNGAVRLGDNGNQEDVGMRVERAWVQGDYNNFQVLLGRLPYVSFVDNGMVIDDNVSGGQITFGNKIQGTITVGRFNTDADNAPGAGAPSNTYSYQAIEIYNNREDKITWGIGFHHARNHAQLDNVIGNGSRDLNIWDIGLGWSFADNFNLNGSYAWNTSVEESAAFAPRGSKRAWSVQIDYKGADPSDKGSWGAFVAYRKLGGLAVLAPTYDAIGGGQEGGEIGFDYVPAKNIMATFKYFYGKDMQWTDNNQTNSEERATKFFTELNFFF